MFTILLCQSKNWFLAPQLQELWTRNDYEMMGVAVSWFVPEAYYGNTFHSNVPSLSCINNQTLWTTDSLLNCKNTEQGNIHESWGLQNFRISLNKPCLIPAGVCVSAWARLYQLLTVNRAQLHAVTPKQLLPSREQSSQKSISDFCGHCVLSYPWASFLRPEKFTGWLRGCTLLGKKKNNLWHFTLGKWTFPILGEK